MTFKIRYKASVARDLRKLNSKDASKLIGKIEQKLGSGGESGCSMKGEFSGLFCLCVGDYRIIRAKIESGFLILRISHRGEAYQKRG